MQKSNSETLSTTVQQPEIKAMIDAGWKLLTCEVADRLTEAKTIVHVAKPGDGLPKHRGHLIDNKYATTTTTGDGHKNKSYYLVAGNNRKSGFNVTDCPESFTYALKFYKEYLN